jgi:hypothetical protein
MTTPSLQILKQDWELCKKHWRKFMPYLYLLFAPTLIVTLTTTISLYITQFIPASDLVSNLIIFALFVASILFSFWVTIALTKFMYNLLKNPDLKETKTYRDYLSGSSHLIWPIILVSILSSIITMGGFILLIVPGVIFAGWYVFSTYVIMLEHKTGTMNALRESKRLIVGRWGAVIWRLFLPGAILAIVLMIGNGVLVGLVNVLTSAGLLQTILVDTLTSIISVVFTPFSAGLVLIVYLEARKTRPETKVEIDPTPPLK